MEYNFRDIDAKNYMVVVACPFVLALGIVPESFSSEYGDLETKEYTTIRIV